eukprot:scaffold155_cov347-Pavlova_lutheri.AAC.48
MAIHRGSLSFALNCLLCSGVTDHWGRSEETRVPGSWHHLGVSGPAPSTCQPGHEKALYFVRESPGEVRADPAEKGVYLVWSSPHPHPCRREVDHVHEDKPTTCDKVALNHTRKPGRRQKNW